MSDLFYSLQLSDTHSTVMYLFINHRIIYYLRTEMIDYVIFIGALIPDGNPIAANKYSISRVSYRPIAPMLRIVQV
jgi:hypothetical protein